MNKILVTLLVLISFCSVSFAISTKDTNYSIIGNGKGIYGKNTSGLGKQLIGINSSNKVSIDSDATGVVMAGELAVRNSIINGIVIASPSTATTINILATTGVEIIAPFTTVATLNVVLPASASNGQIINILASEAVTELKLTSGDGSVENAVTSLTADTCISYIYVSSKTKWYRFK